MNENNLPLKLVSLKKDDAVKNTGGGPTKFFGNLTPELQNQIAGKFNSLLQFYSDVFNENKQVPAVGKIIMKPEAIAKSYKPSDLCRNCSIIGGEDLNEIYIKVNKNNIEETINQIYNPPSKKFRANMTAVADIQPIQAESKISIPLQNRVKKNFNSVKNAIKVKLFDFNDDSDNEQIWNYVESKLDHLDLKNKYKIISYGKKIKFLKIEIKSPEDIKRIAAINGVKTVDFFQEYYLPQEKPFSLNLDTMVNGNYADSNIIIGIIDGGISDENPYLKPYIIGREEYVSKVYQNPRHGTFVASTIQYGNILNGISPSTNLHFKFLDIVAIPNNDPHFGLIDTISEDSLMEIIEKVVAKYSNIVKIWNMSLGVPDRLCIDSMSDLGMFLDYIQDKYNVQFFVPTGNTNSSFLRAWPPQKNIGDDDRLIAPGDSVRAITVGSVALYDSSTSVVKHNEPSPFSRRGPGPNYIVKPDVVDYGGNIDASRNNNALGMAGLNPIGRITNGSGTSYSTPRVLQKYAAICENMINPKPLLAKAMLVHSARMNSRGLYDNHEDYYKYYGFGIPSSNVQNILQCSKDCVTLIFNQKITQGTHLEMFDFPFPKALIKNGKYIGEICMTLVYAPPLDSNYGREYCRDNIDASFGTYKNLGNGKVKYEGKIPLERKWDEKCEAELVKNGFKWSPIKSYYRNMMKGIDMAAGWKLRIDLTSRNNVIVPSQEFVLILTIKDPNGNDIYSEITNGLRERGYSTNNIETKYQLRQRQ